MAQVSGIDADAFCTSIEKALAHPSDADSSIKRLTKRLNRTAGGKLFYSDQKDKATFHTMIDGKQKYLSKKSPLIYPLARRRYYTELIEILKLSESTTRTGASKRKRLISKLQKFIRTCEHGNLDILQIVLTKDQYNWFTGDFQQKYIDESKAFFTTKGLPVRSKSERDIINSCDDLAVPLHYEEQMTIYVQPLVEKLHTSLLNDFTGSPISTGIPTNKNPPAGIQTTEAPAPADTDILPTDPGWTLTTYNNKTIHWNVPVKLQWMNAPGSIWRSYYPPRGTITIYNDLKTMFADGTVFIWEHEGMMDDFVYRCNASERSAIMKYTKIVTEDNFLETHEQDIDNPEKLIDVLEKYVLPRMWF